MRPLRDRLLVGLMALLPLSALAEPVGYAVGDLDLYRLDVGTGQATRVGPIGYRDVEGLAISPDGQLYGVSDAGTGSPTSTLTDFLLAIDPVTGAGTPIGQLGLSGQGVGAFNDLDYGLAITCDGRMWLSSDTTSQLWEVNPSTGGTRLVGNLGARVSGLAAYGNQLYGVSVVGAEGLYAINRDTAQATLMGSLGLPDTVYDAGLDFDAQGRLWVTIDYLTPPTGIPPLRNDVSRLDPATGARLETRVITGAGTDIDTVQMEGLAIAPAPACIVQPIPSAPSSVPGPGLPMLLLLGTLSAAIGLRRLRPA